MDFFENGMTTNTLRDLANFTILEDIFYSCTPFKGLLFVFINFTCDFKMALAPLFD